MRKCLKCHEPKDESEFRDTYFVRTNICNVCRRSEARRNSAEARANREAVRLAKIEAYCREQDEKELKQKEVNNAS